MNNLPFIPMVRILRSYVGPDYDLQNPKTRKIAFINYCFIAAKNN